MLEQDNKYKNALQKIANDGENTFDCASCVAAETAKEALREPELNLEEGSAEVTLTDVYAMFYLLVKQSQKLKPGSKMSFDLNAFKTLPKKVAVNFERKHGRLFVWIPGKQKDRKKKKSGLILPEHQIITPN